MTSIVIINSCKSVTDIQGQQITAALNLVLPKFCTDWGLIKYSVVYVPQQYKSTNTGVKLKIFLLDSDPPSDGILGYHGITSDTPYSNIYCKTTLSYPGATVVYSNNASNPTVAQTVSHEIFEMLVDPNCNMWADDGTGETMYAYETCDPVESNLVQVNVPKTASILKWTGKNFALSRGIPAATVTLSDWVLPSWFDPQRTVGPFNYLKTITSPLSISPLGYTIVSTVSSQTQVTAMLVGEKVDQKRKDRFMAKSRISKKMK